MNEYTEHTNPPDKKESLEPVFDKLDKQRFKRRSGDSFPSVYLTTISIIQGVALGILATQTYGCYKTPSDELIKYIPYSIVCFLNIICVSFEYTWFVGLFKWPPKLMDTVIPFCLGALQITPMFFLGTPEIWWPATMFFYFGAIIGFSNTIWNCKSTLFSDEYHRAYKRVVNALRKNILWVSLATVNCLVATFFCNQFEQTEGNTFLGEYIFVLVLLFIGISMLLRDEKYMTKLHEDFGFIR